MTELVLPWPPTVNTYWRAKVIGRNPYPQFYVSTDGKRYRKNVAGLCMAWKVQPIKGRVRLEILAEPPDRRVRDLDNLLKSLLDSLQHGGLFADDGQIDALSIRRGLPTPGGRITVQAWEVG